MIYLDYASTTPEAPDVIEAMNKCLGADGHFMNASSEHRAGDEARQIIKQARERIA